ncbi:MAG: hypothetical protein KatS3mg115_2030 [Candidatus Poribacteria bacterium]|nr:MAG: hypothetical protein KatS3mg115_2030 [Candidatus Poribacteria bacterium]
MSEKSSRSERIARLAAEAALSRKAQDVLLMDLRGLATFADFFVLCTGTSETHIEGITDIVLERLEEAGERPWHAEGARGAQWVLLDYVDVVVHVFSREARLFYGLERLWADAKQVPLSDEGVPVDPRWEAVARAGEEAGALLGFSAMDDLEADEALWEEDESASDEDDLWDWDEEEE